MDAEDLAFPLLSERPLSDDRDPGSVPSAPADDSFCLSPPTIQAIATATMRP